MANDLIYIVKEYEIISGKKVEWNYVLLDSVNDSLEDAKELFNALGCGEVIKINKFNSVDISELKESNNIKKFISLLKGYGMTLEYYETNGADISAACGQMVADCSLRLKK